MRLKTDRLDFGKLAVRLLESDTPESLARGLAEVTEISPGWEAFFFAERIADGDLFRALYAVDTIKGKKVVEPRESSPRSYAILRPLFEGIPQVFNRTPQSEESLRFKRFGDASRPSASLVFIPVMIGSDLFGIFSVQSYTPNRYSESDVEPLMVIARMTAHVMRRMRAEAQLRENQEMYRRAIAQADAVPYERSYITNELNYMGEGIQRLTGYKTEELTRGGWSRLIKEIIVQGEAAGMKSAEADQAMREGKIANWRSDYRIRTREGKTRWLADSSIPLFDDKGCVRGTLGILQDITDRMESIALNKALSDLGLALNAASTPRELALAVAATADTLFGWDVFYVNMYDEDKNLAYSIVNIDTVDGKRSDFPSIYSPPRKPSPMFEAMLREGAQLILRDDDEEAAPVPLITPTPNPRRSASMMFTCIRDRAHHNVGQLSIQSYTPNAYDSRDLEWLQVLADYCSGALRRTFVEAELRKSRERAAAFATLAHRLNSVRTDREAGMIIAETADMLLGWDAFSVSHYNPENNALQTILNFDTHPDGKRELFLSHSPQNMSAIGQRVIEEGGVKILRTPREIESGIEQTGTIVFGNTDRRSASLLYAPVRKSDQVVGIISIQSYTHYAYSEESLEILQSLADHCGGALERLRMEKSLEEEQQRLSVFSELGRELAAASTPKEAGKIIVNAAKTLLGWDACFLLLYSRERNYLTPIFNVDLIDGRPVEVPMDHFAGSPGGFTGETIRTGKRLILREDSLGGTDTTLGFGNTNRRSASLMFVPIRKASQVIGVLSIQSYTPYAYTEESLDVLESLAHHCSGALDRIQTEEAMRESEERYALALRGANDGIWDWNLQANRIYFSTRWKHMLRYAEMSMGDAPEEWFSRIHPNDLEKFKEALQAHIDGKTGFFQHEHRICSGEGEYLWVLCRGIGVRDSEGRVVRLAGSMTDITERRNIEEQLRHSAFYDSLTGLANRSLFYDRLNRCFLHLRRYPKSLFAVLFIDLDRFKLVNDMYGHAIGDKVLQRVADHLRKCLREGDTVARLGGDEFTILLDDLKESNEALRVAERLLRELSVPVNIEDNEIVTGASIGIALSSSGYENSEEMVRDADAALFRAKESGRGRFILLDQRTQESASLIFQLEQGLQTALSNNELRLDYQPIFSVEKSELCGLEALVRWQHPRLGLLPPRSFLPVAESSGLIVPLGEWILRTACGQIARWRRDFPKYWHVYISVNLSPKQACSPGLYPLVETVLSENDLSPDALHLEISESTLLNFREQLQPTIGRLRKLGVRVLLDDFGAGQTAISTFLECPIDYLKMDRSIVSNLDNQPDNRPLIRALLSLAHILKIGVIAKGAETEAQVKALRELQCDFVQGFFVSRPLSPPQVTDLLR
jgi:diguanylate cyclase (GGDEF)-like protein/PAS domain S-box-containing protein